MSGYILTEAGGELLTESGAPFIQENAATSVNQITTVGSTPSYAPISPPTTVPTITGQQFAARIADLFPRNWAGDDAKTGGAVYAFLLSLGNTLSGIIQSIDYDLDAARMQTATAPELDLASEDYFGDILPRPTGMADSDFAQLIIANLFRPAATRPALFSALTDLCGQPPRMLEPWSVLDTGWWRGKSYWNVDTRANPARWGNGSLRYQGFIETTPPLISVVGANNPVLTWGTAYWNVPGYFFGIISTGPQNQIYDRINRLKAEGTLVWVKLVNSIDTTTLTPTKSSIVPSAPTGLVIGQTDAVSVLASWTASTNGTPAPTYSISYRPAIGGTWVTFPTKTYGTSLTVTGLSSGTQYEFQVAATNALGTTPAPSTTKATTASATTTPSAPTAVAGTAVSAASILVSWPASASGNPAPSYAVSYRTSLGSGPWTPFATTTFGTNLTVTGLTSNTQYEFEVTASNSAGSATSTSTAIVATLPSAVIPTAPTGLTATSIDSSHVLVSWTASSAGNPAPSFAVSYRTPAGSGTYTPFGTTTFGTSLTIGSLASNTRYEFQVTATNASGSAIDTITATASTLATDPNPTPIAPSAPSNLAASATGTTTVLTGWGASTTGAPAPSYSIAYRTPVGSGSWTTFASTTFGTNLTVTGLLPGTRYEFQVTATNASGSTVDPITTSAITTTATVAPAAPTGFSAVSKGTSSALASWIASSTGTPAPAYSAGYRTPAGSGPWSTFGTTTAGTSLTVTGLLPGTQYEFQVTATNTAGSATDAVTSTTTTDTAAAAPTSPSGLTASATDSSDILVSWVASSAANPAPSYSVAYRTSAVSSGGSSVNAGSWIVFGTTTFGTSITVSGLLPSTAYDFQVTASNSAGTTVGSTIATATTAQPVLTPASPSAVTALAVSTDTGSATLTWGPPTTGYPTNYAYTAFYRTTGSETFLAGPTVAGSPAFITGLQSNVSYDFEVIVRNSAGQAASGFVTATTLKVPPGPATNLAVTNIGTTALTLSWLAPNTGTAPFKYYAQYRVSGTTTWTQFGSAGNYLTITITGLTASTSYELEVVTTNAT